MASPGHEYTLVGFSEEVDRRPLVFVEALPAARVCSACGLLPKAIALHLCAHYFCKPCYEQCVRHDEVVCPLDGEACLEEEVNWINYSTRSVMTKKVRCWNRRNGCNVVTAAADIPKHFHNECGHHSARCPKCAAEILANDVCAHLESRCDVSREPGAVAVHARTNASEEEENVSVTRSDLSNGFQRIHNAISTAVSSIEAELRKIGRTMEITVMAATPRHEEADQRSFETRIFQENLSQLTVQTANLKDQLDEFMQNAYANQQTFYNSFVEKNEAFKKSLADRISSKIDQSELATQFAAFREAMGDGQRETKAELERISSRIDQSELATQFAAFREAMGDGQRETKAELDRLAVAIDRQHDRMGELLRSTDPSRETRTRNSAESAEAQTDSSAEDASKIAWAKSTSAEDRQNALALLPSIIPAATTHTWTLEEYRSLMQRAESEFLPTIMLEPVYLRGYCVSVSFGFYTVGNVYLLLKLHKGKLDRYLEWPFNLQIRLSILHPEGNRKLEYCVTPSRLPWYKDKFSRLLQGSDSIFIVGSPRFNDAQLEELGFTKGGRLLLSLSLEDPPTDEEP